jgi:hypothetical protein
MFNHSLKLKALLALSLMLFSGFATNTFVFHNSILPIANATSCSFALDGSGASKHSSGSVTSLGMSLSTSCNNDLLVAYGYQEGNTTLSVSDSSSLTWQIEDQYYWWQGNATLGVFYASAPSVISSDTVTFSSTASAYMMGMVFAVSDANLSNPFDILALQNNTGSSTSPSVTVSTLYPDDMLLGFSSSNGIPTFNSGSGYTKIGGVSNINSIKAEYEIVTQLQDDKNVNYALSTSEQWTILADAIREDPTSGTPFGLDNHSSNVCTTTNQCSVTLTTHYANEIVYVVALSNGSDISGVSDSNNLAWTAGPIASEWSSFSFYAVAGSTLSSDTITASTTYSGDNLIVIAFSVSGAVLSPPLDAQGGGWDSGCGYSCVSAFTGEDDYWLSLSTLTNQSDANSLVVGVVSDYLGLTGLTVGSGFTSVASSIQAWGTIGVEDKSVSSISPVNVSYSWNCNSCDAIGLYAIVFDKAAVSSGPITLTNPVWLGLHGADYGDQNLSHISSSVGISTDLSNMKSEGFNFMRLPLSWDVLEKKGLHNFEGNLTALANKADAENIQVVYDAHTSGSGSEPGEFLPSNLARTSACPTSNTILTCWLKNETTYNGVNGWKAVWTDFWVPVLNIVDSHNSTFGYEMANEPNLGNASTGDLRNYYKWISANMLSYGTQRRIVFMGPHAGNSLSTIEAVYPTGVPHLIDDIHCYPDTCGTVSSGGWSNVQSSLSSDRAIQNWLQNHSSDSGARVWIGEWNACNQAIGHTGCNALSQSQINTNITTMVTALKAVDFANTYWAWRYDTFNVPLLLDTSAQTYWLTNDLGSDETGI